MGLSLDGSRGKMSTLVILNLFVSLKGFSTSFSLSSISLVPSVGVLCSRVGDTTGHFVGQSRHLFSLFPPLVLSVRRILKVPSLSFYVQDKFLIMGLSDVQIYKLTSSKKKSRLQYFH